MDHDQAQQNVGPDLDPKLFDILMVFLKEFFENVNFEKKKKPKQEKKIMADDKQKMKNFQASKELKMF